jgi:hypothetical protein
MKFKVIYISTFLVGFSSSAAIGSELLSNEREFTIQCSSMIIKGKSHPSISKIVAKNGFVQLFSEDGKAGRVSKVVELRRGKDLDSNNYYSFNLFSEYEHTETYDSYTLYPSGSLSWEVAIINTSRNIIISANVLEFQNCLSLGLN